MCLWRQALGPRLIWVSRIGVVVWSIIMGIAMTVVQAANININWLINSIGVFVGGAVPPLIFVLTWRRCNGVFATSGEPSLTLSNSNQSFQLFQKVSESCGPLSRCCVTRSVGLHRLG